MKNTAAFDEIENSESDFLYADQVFVDAVIYFDSIGGFQTLEDLRYAEEDGSNICLFVVRFAQHANA